MDISYNVTKQFPRSKTNFFQRILDLEHAPLFWKTIKCGINLEDLYKVSEEDSSKYLADKLEKLWHEQVQNCKKSNRKPTLALPVFKLILPFYIYEVISCVFFFVILRSSQLPLFVSFVRSFSADDDSNTCEKIVTGLLLVLLNFATNLQNHYSVKYLTFKGSNLRVALTAVIYRKVLRTSVQNCKVSTGKIINLISNELNRIEELPQFFHHIAIAPLQTIAVCYFLYYLFDVPGFAGLLAVSVSIIALTIIFSKISAKAKRTSTQKTDNRIKVMREILTGINVIKMYAWEKRFEQKIKAIRKDELKYIKLYNIFNTIITSYRMIIQKFSIYITVILFVVMGKTLEAHCIFCVALAFGFTRYSSTLAFPRALIATLEVKHSLKRIEEILLQNEIENKLDANCERGEIIFSDVFARWTKDSVLFDFQKIHVRPGSLCIIVGPVGCGKSTLLQLLLKEIVHVSGDIKLNGNVSYCSQEPWLFSSSVRSNILVGQNYDETLYKNVVDVCDLKEDFSRLSHGDLSLVGEKGVILSGGQRARVNLARALYQEADIYLLDDPLSAVDAKVANHIFEKGVKGFLKTKTRILVTHQIQFLNSADLVVVLKNGKIEGQGTLKELKKRNICFTQLILNNENEGMNDDTLIDSRDKDHQKYVEKPQFSPEEGIFEIGSFLGYIKTMGIFKCILCITLTIASIAFMNATELYMSIWTSYSGITNTTNSNFFVKNSYQPLKVLSIIFLGGAVTLATVKFFFVIYLTNTASAKLHENMFEKILRAPINFFYTYPVGRILNRFTKDTVIIDENLPVYCQDVIELVPLAIAAMIVLIYCEIYFIIPTSLHLIVFIIIGRIWVKCLNTLKHLEAIAKSPVFDYLNSTVAGIKTIRSTNSIEMAKHQFDAIQDIHSAAHNTSIACINSFALYLDFFQNFLLNVLVVISILLVDHFVHNMSESVVALVVFKSLTSTGIIQYGIRRFANGKLYMVSVSRILEFGEMEAEKPFETKSIDKPPEPWPKHGKIEFKNVHLKYNPENPYVLKNLNIIIRPKEKIGIVGRTGAGKSSLITAIFHLVNFEGKILIDDVDTKCLGFTDLRSKISIIPQEPVLFSDTIRYNLDPFFQYRDTQIWEALEEVELKETIPDLNFMVTEGGSNFSVGQRQLLCLARAILRRNKILILDEATANIDFKTDEIIQKTIKKKFEQYTVLTIAHRLNTVMESDKILVMESGKIVQYEHPHILSCNKDGVFYKFLRETDKDIARHLMQIAQNDYMKKIRNED